MMARIDRTTMIIAIALALFLWAYVRMAHDSRELTRTLANIPVHLEGNAPAGFSCDLHENDKRIEIKVIGPAESVNNLSPEDIVARVDLAGVTKSKTIAKPSVKLPKGIRPASIPKVTLLAYPLKEKTFRVRVSFIVQPPPGASVGEFQIQPESVRVEGREDALKQVKYVTIDIDPAQVLNSEREMVPHAVDADGKRVLGVSILNTSSVKVRSASLTGQQTTRQVAVAEPELTNIPPDTTVHVVNIRPRVVTLSGDGTQLSRLEAFIETEPINVRAAAKNTTISVRLRVPKGLSVVEGSTVLVDIESQPTPSDQ